MLEYSEELKMLRQLIDISLLKDNWNDNEAKAFSKEQIKSCYELFDYLPFYMDILPVANGSIQFEHENDKQFIKFNVFEDHISAFEASLTTDWHLDYPNINTIDLVDLLKGNRRKAIYDRSQVKKIGEWREFK